MSGEEKRIFVAVPMPEEARTAVARGLEGIRFPGRDHLSWVRPENFHLTVKFLGGVPVDRIPALISTLAGAAGAVPSFSLCLEGVGAFPSWKGARVLWIGVAGDLEVFRRLAGRVDRLCGDLGFPREKRDAAPHLTLARRKDPGGNPDLRADFAPMATFFHGPFTVSRMHLMESRLLPGGASYAILETFTLRGDLK